MKANAISPIGTAECFSAPIRKNIILFLCLPLAILAWISPLGACVAQRISNGYTACPNPNQIAGDLQDVPGRLLLVRGGGGGDRGRSKGAGNGYVQCDGLEKYTDYGHILHKVLEDYSVCRPHCPDRFNSEMFRVRVNVYDLSFKNRYKRLLGLCDCQF